MELKTINEQPDGFCPPEVSVRIVKVWDRKKGTNETGDWSFQNVDVEQNGTKATLKLKNLPEFPNSRAGQTVTIRAHKSDTHGLTGIKTETREYNGKTYKSVVITPSGKWDWGAVATSSNGAAQAAPVAQNGIESSTAYSDHILSCAELANLVMGNLCVEDPAAIQACFATICIDTKNRNILLPKPKTLAAVIETPTEPEARPGHEENPFEEELEDIPF